MHRPIWLRHTGLPTDFRLRIFDMRSLKTDLPAAYLYVNYSLNAYIIIFLLKFINGTPLDYFDLYFYDAYTLFVQNRLFKI